jgi:hypothetical protein
VKLEKMKKQKSFSDLGWGFSGICSHVFFWPDKKKAKINIAGHVKSPLDQ